MTIRNNIHKVLLTINMQPRENMMISRCLGQPYDFHPPHHEIFSWSHGEIPITNTYFPIEKSYYYYKLSHWSKISWSHGLSSSHNHQEIFSWSHCLMVIFSQNMPPPMRLSHGLMVKLLLQISTFLHEKPIINTN